MHSQITTYTLGSIPADIIHSIYKLDSQKTNENLCFANYSLAKHATTNLLIGLSRLIPEAPPITIRNVSAPIHLSCSLMLSIAVAGFTYRYPNELSDSFTTGILDGIKESIVLIGLDNLPINRSLLNFMVN